MKHNIYVAKAGRVGGFGRKTLDFAENVCRERQMPALWLTVNKDNAGAIAGTPEWGSRTRGRLFKILGRDT